MGSRDKMKIVFNVEALYKASSKTAAALDGLKIKAKAAADAFKQSSTKVIRALDKQKEAVSAYNRKVGDIRGRTEGWQRVLGRLRNQILLVTFALSGFIVTIKKSIDAAKEEEAALLGLGAVAEKVGESKIAATEAAKEFTKDGLLSIKDAAAGLKNLLSSGFGMKEAREIMTTLTDAAAFNRQGTLSMGQAIVGATQGIKNQNCQFFNTLIYDTRTRKYRTIEDIHENWDGPFFTLSYNEETEELEYDLVTHSYYNGIQEGVKITLESNKETTVTPDHLMYTQRGWVEAGDLIPNEDQILAVDNHTEVLEEIDTCLYCQYSYGKKNNTKKGKICDSKEDIHVHKTKRFFKKSWEKVVEVEKVKEGKVYDLTIKKNHNFMANQMIVHNCLKYDTVIYDPVRRESRTIEEWHDEGIVPCVLSVNRQTGGLEVIQAEYLHYNGENEIFEIELENGTTIEATANHRFLTQDGFKFLEDLDIENDILYYVDEKLVDEELYNNDIIVDNDLKRQNSAQKNIQVNTTQEQKRKKINQELLQKLKLNAKSAEKYLNLLKGWSKKDLEDFVQKNVESKILKNDSVERIVLVLLEELKKNIKPAERLCISPQGHLIKEKDSVQENPTSYQKLEQQWNIKDTEKKYIKEIPFDVYDAIELLKVILTYTIFLDEENIPNDTWNQKTDSLFVQDVTNKSVKILNHILKKFLRIIPIPLKIKRIISKGSASTYDLSVPEQFNYLASSIVSHNSIMVDNAGITKNLSIMYKEFADTIGTTSGKLTEAQKRSAIYFGILKEGTVFTGNAIQLTKTYAGAVSKLGVALFEVRSEMGKVLMPILKETVLEISNTVKLTKEWIIANKEWLDSNVGEFLRITIQVLQEFGRVLGGVTVGIKSLANENTSLVMVLGKLYLASKLYSLIAVDMAGRIKKLIIIFRQYHSEAQLGSAATVKLTSNTQKLVAVFGRFSGTLTTGVVLGLRAIGSAIAVISLQVGGMIAAFTVMDWLIGKFSKWVEKTKEAEVITKDYLHELRDLAGQLGGLTGEYKSLNKEINTNNKEQVERIKLIGQEMRLKVSQQLQVIAENYKEFTETIKNRTGAELDLINMQKKGKDELNKYKEVLLKVSSAMKAEATEAFQKQSEVTAELSIVADKLTGTFKDLGIMTEKGIMPAKLLKKEYGETAANLLKNASTVDVLINSINSLLVIRDYEFKSVKELSKSYTDLMLKIKRLKEDIEESMPTDTLSTYDKLVKKHQDTLTNYKRKIEDIKIKMNAEKEGVEELTKEYNKLLTAFEKLKTAKPIFKTEYSFEDLAKGLREAMKSARAGKVLGEFLFGPAAIEAQKVNIKQYSSSIIDHINTFIAELGKQGLDASKVFAEMFGISPSAFAANVKESEKFRNSLIDIQKGYYDFVSIEQEKALKKDLAAKEVREKIASDLAQFEIDKLREKTILEDQIRLNSIERERAKYQFYEEQMDKHLEYALNHNLKAYIAMKGTIGLINGLQEESHKLFVAIWKDKTRKEITFAKLMENLGRHVYSSMLSGLSEYANQQSKLYLAKAIAAIGEGIYTGNPAKFAAAAKFTAAASAFAVLGGTAGGAAASLKAGLHTFETEEAKIAEPTTAAQQAASAPTGTISQPIGGLDLGPSPWLSLSKLPQASSSSTVNFSLSADTMMIGTDIVTDPDSIKESFRSLLVEVVNEETETGRI